MKERPILFSTPMVKAILDGRKTVTRRVINPQPWDDEDGIRFPWATFFHSGNVFTWDDDGIGGENWDAKDHPNENKYEQALLRTQYSKPTPYGKPGDILWVRETFHVDMDGVVTYKADHPHIEGIWKPSIFMPREACRLKLEIVSIRVERLHDITEEDAIREGLSKITKDGGRTWKYGIPDNDGLPGTDDNGWPWTDWNTFATEAFFTLWRKINGDESFQANPWVWRIEFKKLLTDD